MVSNTKIYFYIYIVHNYFKTLSLQYNKFNAQHYGYKEYEQTSYIL